MTVWCSVICLTIISDENQFPVWLVFLWVSTNSNVIIMFLMTMLLDLSIIIMTKHGFLILYDN